MPNIRSITVLPALPDVLKDLEIIAKNMYWSWHTECISLFERIDNNLWSACGHNPVKLLGSVSQHKLQSLAENQGFLHELRRAKEKLDIYLQAPTWFEKVCTKTFKPTIAYFCAEFGIHECLPIYSGGLGILAGDHLKSASDLGIPLVAMGLMYQKGYFRQQLNIDGWQQEIYVENDAYNLPLELVRQENGQPLIIAVDYPGRTVQAQIWRVAVGRVSLYLLDTNIPVNSPGDRMITSSLYGGDRELRIRQEILLGIGGLRALEAMGIEPTVCHMNEGHAAFMALERIRRLRDTKGMTFEEALEATRAGNVFTVHTLVKAGLDEFSAELMDKYFEDYFPQLGIDRSDFLALGRMLPDDERECFKMPVLALKLSAYANGVSQLHGRVSRELWGNLWPGVPSEEVPIKAITNGVHIKTWVAPEIADLYDRYLGPNWSQEVYDKSVWDNVTQIPDEELWGKHQRCKEQLIVFARRRLRKQLERRGTYRAELNRAEEVLDPEALTIGFARRFASYKRGDLLLRDAERLIRMLSDEERPLQLVFAGKAHPKDNEGKDIIRHIVQFATNENVRRRIVFLEDYDIDVARVLVRGVDVWLNNPRRPMEASGTSGMKAAFNGVMNLSTLDGWWCEGYQTDGGWAIGAGEVFQDPEYQDMLECQSLYEILENEIVPLFYSRSVDGLPRAWIQRMKQTIRWVVPRFNTHRMLADYTRRFYNPAAARWRFLSAEAMARARAFSQWKSHVREVWPALEIQEVTIDLADSGCEAQSDIHQTQIKVGSELCVRARVTLGQADPHDVAVELYHGPVDTWGHIRQGQAVGMDLDQPNGDEGCYWFRSIVPCTQTGQHGIAVRVLPHHPDMVSPHEMGLILWEASQY